MCSRRKLIKTTLNLRNFNFPKFTLDMLTIRYGLALVVTTYYIHLLFDLNIIIIIIIIDLIIIRIKLYYLILTLELQ